MIPFLSLILVFLLGSVGFSDTQSIRLSEGRYVVIENNVTDPSQPTFVLLPGLYRGLNQTDVSFFEIAKEKNLNFVSLHFSLHAESVMSIPKNETPYFKLHQYSSTDLADEVEKIISHLQLKTPVVVGLSYSSSVTTELAKRGKYPLVVETAPLIQYEGNKSLFNSMIPLFEGFLALNPFFGTNPFGQPASSGQKTLSSLYEQFWLTQVGGLLNDYPDRKYNTLLRVHLAKAYSQLSMAVEGFDYRTQDFKSGPKRLFILGEHEVPKDLTLQKEAIAIYERETGDTKSTVVIKNSGHIVPDDEPASYIEMLMKTIEFLPTKNSNKPKKVKLNDSAADDRKNLTKRSGFRALTCNSLFS